jgi:hypothetical protein
MTDTDSRTAGAAIPPFTGGRLRPAAPWLVAAGLILTACTSQGSAAKTPTAALPTGSLGQAQELWSAAGISRYSYTVTSACGERPGLGTFHVTVDGDTVQVVPKDRHTGPATVVRVDQLFAAIKQAEDYHADRVKVTYNQQLGYPESINIDYSKTGIDDEQCYTVRDFTADGA